MSHRASSNISPLSLSRYWFPLTTCFLESPRDNFSLGDTKCSVVVLRIEACLALPDGSEVFWVMIKLAPGFLVQMNEVHCRRKADNYYRQANTLRQATTMPADGGKLEGIWSIKTWSQARSHPSNPTECRDTEDFLFPDTTSNIQDNKLIIDRQGACNHCVTHIRPDAHTGSLLLCVTPGCNLPPSLHHTVTQSRVTNHTSQPGDVTSRHFMASNLRSKISRTARNTIINVRLCWDTSHS